VTGRGPERFVAVVEGGDPAAVILERAERAGADLIVLGDGDGVVERVVRNAHCPVLVVRAQGRAQRILVATDLSDPSLPALTAAKDEAARTGAAVTALHCVEPALALVGPEHGLAIAPAVPVEVSRTLRHSAREALSGALREVGLQAAEMIAEGPPAGSIVQAAAELPADLVVIGTHGRTGLARVLLGSVAEGVLRRAPCSVLAVRLSPGV
jgi:nucleotide-binding universal stress UspA family protein